eukprot:TRINITY_DN9722_c0_g1_i1.p1 TRINITY_DN9722_c0_g1~~TRINITY_DN9722_c0_g1_i1.p1  ORF type:complete len:196 (+),score=47.74 TRINITY_DN9722_c0_g1_i1:13-600(+)
MSDKKLFYFQVKARGFLPFLVNAYGNLGYEYIHPEWPALKSEAPFGQLPFLQDGSLKVAESAAITRFLARKAKIEGDNDEDFAHSEQAIEFANDILTALAQAHYGSDKKAGYKKFYEELPTYLGKAEKVLKGDFFASKLTTGDLAIFSILNIIVDAHPTALDNNARLKAHYNRIAAIPSISAALPKAGHPYFKPE